MQNKTSSSISIRQNVIWFGQNFIVKFIFGLDRKIIQLRYLLNLIKMVSKCDWIYDFGLAKSVFGRDFERF